MDDAPSAKRLSQAASRQVTVREAVIHLLRGFGCTTMFGNPGSTELPLFRDWPKDFRYVLGLQESVVMGMADGYAQATHNAAFVNLHSAAGVGHSLGNLFTAWKNNAPVVVIAGQQARAMLPMEPFLGATAAPEFPKPYVKFSVEPARAEDVPAAIARAYYVAMTEPRGPTFVSVPVDDWDKATDLIEPRQVITRRGPDPHALAAVGEALEASKTPVIVVGSDVDRSSGGFYAVVDLAERFQTPVWVAPRTYRCGFPETHPLFAGFLPPLKAGVAAKLKGHDLVLVLGAPAFTYHNETLGPFLPEGAKLIQIVSDPDQAAYTPEGMSVVGNVGAAVLGLLERPAPAARPKAQGRGPLPEISPSAPIPPRYLMQQLRRLRPDGAIIVEEAPTARDPMNDQLPIDTPDGFLTTGSGGLGYGLPASVGAALARPDRRVIALIGDGSAMYGIQALWSAAQLKLPMTIVIINNGCYLALKHMAEMFQMKDPVGIELPGIDFLGLARALGCEAARADQPDMLDAALKQALESKGPFLLEVMVEASF